MELVKVKAFFSCSFEDEDKDVVGYFLGICKGMDIECVNVDRSYADIPAEKARELINESRALVAIATRRAETKNGKVNMPRAVNDEIAMAFGVDKPILLAVEDGVNVDEGFAKGYGTYITFTRDKLHDPEFLEKMISSVHQLRMRVLSPSDLTAQQLGAGEFYFDWGQLLISLEEEDGEFVWDYSSSRKLVFTGSLRGRIIGGAWPCVAVKSVDQSKLLEWNYQLDTSSRHFELKPTIEKHAADSIEIFFDVSPQPQAGDYIVFSQNYRSKYLNPIYREDLESEVPFVILGSNKYLCGDGVITIRSGKKIKIQFIFPREYGLEASDFAPFVGSVTTRVDSVVESEMERMVYEVETFGKKILIKCNIDRPLVHLMYGVAWNPPNRKEKES